MGTEAEARALAAGDTIEVKGKTYTLRPVVAQSLCDLEREALKHYKRQYLETYAENADLLSNGKATELIERKMDQVAGWDLNNLPQKDAYDVSLIPITDKIRKWAEEHGGEEQQSDNAIRAVLSVALENGDLKSSQVKQMTGKNPIRGRVRYDQWWITATMTGMVAFIAAGVRREHPEVTRNQVDNWPFPKIAEAARTVERLTAASVGNI